MAPIAFVDATDRNPTDRGAPVLVRLHGVLLALLPHRVPTLELAARHLHLSVRTLQRRLQHQETTFRVQLDRARVELAAQLLAQREFSVNQVGAHLGYSRHSAFSRAYRRWRGETPRQARSRLVRRSNSLPLNPAPG